VGIGMAFLLGLLVSSIDRFIKDLGQPRVHSEEKVRSRYPSLPADASQVYYSYRGFTDVDHFLAFTASEAKIDVFLQDRFSTTLGSFKPIPAVLESLVRHGPQVWEPKYQDNAWNLASAGSLVAWTNESAHTLIYSKSLSRVFVCEWGQ
jgi:hypothetical protein